MPDEDSDEQRRARERMLSHLRATAAQQEQAAPRRVTRKALGLSVLTATVLLGLVVFGVVWDQRQEQESAREAHQELVRSIDQQCDDIYDTIESDAPLEERASRLRDLGVFDFYDARRDVMEDLCPDVVDKGQEVVGQQTRIDDAHSTDADDSATIDEEAYDECGDLGGWVADSHAEGRFTASEYDSWLGIVAQCYEDAGR